MCSFVMFLLIGTVLYLFCKSYHCDRIDESALCDCLPGYLPVELKVEDDDDYEKPSTGHDTV